MLDRSAPRRGARALGTTLAVLLLLAAVTRAAAQPSPDTDIDTADAATLAATLPGIGPVKARRIVEHRERHGPFGDLDALQAVKGIGPATVERIRAHLSGRTEPPAAPDRTPAERPANAVPRSTSELERATRRAVRDIVADARRDAAAAMADDAR